MRILFTPAYSGSAMSMSKYHSRSSMPLETFDTLQGLALDNEWVTPNNGNIIHAESSAKIFQCDRSLSTIGKPPGFKENDDSGSIEKKINRVRKEFDAIVLNFANIIHRKDKLTDEAFAKLESGFSSTATLIENLDGVKIFAYGVGVQDEMDPDKSLIGPQLYRLLQALNAKAVVFGTRGFATESFLHGIGLENAVALGCPSMYVNPQATENVKQISIKNDCKVTAAGRLSISGIRSGRIQPILDFAKRYNTDYTFQNDLFGLFPPSKLNEVSYNSESHEISRIDAEIYMRNRLSIPNDFSKFYYFRSPQAWRAYSGTRDIYIGDRFHGGVAFLQTGVPAGFIYDDARVLELTSFFGLPAFKPHEVVDFGPEEVLNIIVSRVKLEEFKDLYRDRRQQFSSVNRAAGLITKF